MPNEKIRLEFVEYTPRRAMLMIEDAREFAVATAPTKSPGIRRGWVISHGRFDGDDSFDVVAYWTAGGTVVVRQVGVDRG